MNGKCSLSLFALDDSPRLSPLFLSSSLVSVYLSTFLSVGQSSSTIFHSFFYGFMFVPFPLFLCFVIVVICCCFGIGHHHHRDHYNIDGGVIVVVVVVVAVVGDVNNDDDDESRKDEVCTCKPFEFLRRAGPGPGCDDDGCDDNDGIP
mmetsp:Transcript_3140/g.4581  ORF Transcript_3140/g.4581 Transcript_3140/m.4581 type:complete len:148 (+) Transcript_3140:222-665(+)